MGCFDLGVVYRDGLGGVAVDKARAATYFESGCNGGNAYGCANLADLLEYGDGVPKDEKRADDLLHRACAGGHQRSCEQLGLQPEAQPEKPLN